MKHTVAERWRRLSTLRHVAPLRRGFLAERLARWYLHARGCRLIARNFARPGGEIDLVVLDGNTLVFVEVRFRGSRAWASPLESIDAAKQARIRRTASAFLQAHPEHAFRPTRFDAIAASKGHFGLRYRWVQDAYR